MQRRRLVINQTLFRVQRRLVLHIAREYRTMSHAAATVLAGVPPADLLARKRADVYRMTASPGGPRMMEIARDYIMEEWQSRLLDSLPIELSEPLYPVSATK